MIKGIREFYAGIAGSYEPINSLLTLGFDKRWRKKLVAEAARLNPNPISILDMCSGTGQTAGYLSRRFPGAKIMAADFSDRMLAKARDKMSRQRAKNLFFTLADAVHLPFADNTFDIITLTFATRNLGAAPGHLPASFREFYRVLKPGGFYLNLETSQPPQKIIKKLFHIYVKMTVRPIGRLLSGSDAGYTYLSDSIHSFYSAPELARVLHEAGFKSVHYRRFLFGASALHIAHKS
jgi:demethylmenaquinone methyltransferase/2-methoxy-6-polyprenyl-1,4-benzoquinol methylase